VIKCAKFFTALSNLSVQLRHFAPAHDKPQLAVSVDAGIGWVCPPPGKGCFNLTYNGKTQSVAAHVVDLADEVTIMDYRAWLTHTGCSPATPLDPLAQDVDDYLHSHPYPFPPSPTHTHTHMHISLALLTLSLSLSLSLSLALSLSLSLSL
jgi:hypothetical protein